MTKRGKAASDEDRALFDEAVKGATPLKQRLRPVVHAPPARVAVHRPHIPAQPVFADAPAPPIGGHTDAHLRRGRLDPEARLDLHGLTREAAYRATLRFLLRCQANGFRLVLVITGKGGILRAELPFWLGHAELNSLVAGLGEAHVKHGGSGAFYVYLRGSRRFAK